MADQDKVVLAPKYYLDYFKYLLDFIQKTSAHLLAEEERIFIQVFNELSEDAQCLLVRMLNRRGEFFRIEKLQYEEISDVGAATQELVEAEFISLDPPSDPALFGLFVKAELLKKFPEPSLKKLKKPEILVTLLASDESWVYESLLAGETILFLLVQELVEYLKMLFFGHTHGQMTEFVVRDVGHVQYEDLQNHEFTAWFHSLEEAKIVFRFSREKRVIRELMELGDLAAVLEFILPINWSDLSQYASLRTRVDKLLLELGNFFERNKKLETALEYYALSRKHPARERRIRILDKLGESEEARQLAEVAAEHPLNPSEKIFALDFMARKSKRNFRSTTQRIKQNIEISFEKDPSINVEKQALLHFEDLGYEGLHCENKLWRSLFGLVFWEVLFENSEGVFHHPLQRVPSDLYDQDFYFLRKDGLHQQINKFRSKKSLIAHIENVSELKNGINNPFVYWSEDLKNAMIRCVNLLTLKSLKSVMLEMAKNIKANGAGFPDLFIWKGKDYHFYEVKSPNDHLSEQQLFWLDFFAKQGIRCEVLRVNYL